jgi:hypothetical protein
MADRVLLKTGAGYACHTTISDVKYIEIINRKAQAAIVLLDATPVKRPA